MEEEEPEEMIGTAVPVETPGEETCLGMWELEDDRLALLVDGVEGPVGVEG
jgi:hypothetical protein